MTSWNDFAAAAPDFASQVRSCLTVRKHATMATLRRDGSPRISGTELELDDDGWIYVGMMPASRKALDLRRDARLAVHGPTTDPPDDTPGDWIGEAKLAGQAIETASPERGDDAHRFRIDIDEVVYTRVDGDELVVTSWHPGRGVEEHRRK
jgi:hypothetical protein